MEGQSQTQATLRLVVGSVLWGVSSLLTAGLFVGLAGDDLWRKVILFLLAVALEGAKILCWRMGRAARGLAVSLIALSALGSLGAALETVEEFREARRLVQHPETPLEAQARGELLEIDRQISILLNRLEVLPPDFVKAAGQLNDELTKLRADRTVLRASPNGEGDAVRSEQYQNTMFDLMAQVFGIPTETLMLILLLFLAINLEVAALVLAGHSTAEPLQDNVLSPEAFLDAAKDGAALPILHGRDVTAKKLGISYYQAKRHVAALTASGAIRAVGRRLVLCQP